MTYLGMTEEDEQKLISDANRLIAKQRWERASLRTRITQGAILKLGRLRASGYLMCVVCGRGIKRNQEGKYVHVNSRVKGHEPKA